MKCKLCKREFKNRRSLSKHLSQKHSFDKDKILEYYKSIDVEENKDNYVECKICGNYYKSLSYHLKLSHSISSNEYKTKYNSPIISKKSSEKLKNNLSNYYKSLSNDEKSIRGIKSAETRKRNNTNKGGRPKGIPMKDEQKKYLSKLFYGENNPFYNKNHTETSKQKMRGKRNHITGENNPFYKKYYNSIEFKTKFKNTHLELWKNRDENWRKQFREKLSKSIAMSNKQTQTYKNHKHCHWYSNKCDKVGYLRSSWEIYLATIIDELDIIEKYNIEPLCIEYFDYNLEIYRYTRIDFKIKFINDINLLLEVKPNIFINQNIYKLNGIIEYSFENEYEFIVLSDDCFFDYNRVIKILSMIYNKKLSMTDIYKKSNYNNALIISNKID